MGVLLLPWRWHILSIPSKTGRGISAETCGLDDVFPPEDRCSDPETHMLMYVYMYFYISTLDGIYPQ